MRVLSVNVGLPREVPWRGRAVLTAIFKEPVAGRVPLRRLNLDGDRQADLSVHGGAAKAIYAYPLEHYPFWREELAEELPLGAFGENLTVEGIQVMELTPGTRLRVGDEVELEITMDRPACRELRQIHPGALKALVRRNGKLAHVVKTGVVKPGDSIQVVDSGSTS